MYKPLIQKEGHGSFTVLQNHRPANSEYKRTLVKLLAIMVQKVCRIYDLPWRLFRSFYSTLHFRYKSRDGWS